MPSRILERFFFYFQKLYEPAHKILSVILYTQTPSGTRGLHFGLHPHPCLLAGMDLISLPDCTGWPEPLLPDNAVSAKISCAGLYVQKLLKHNLCADPGAGTGGPDHQAPPSLKNHKAIDF